MKIMKMVTLVFLGLFFIAATSAAETKYVTEDLNITLRTGPGTDRKIIAFPNSGDPLEIVTPGEEYTEVMTRSGKQGFVLTRYLTDKEPSSVVLARLQQKYNDIVEKYNDLKQRASQMTGDTKNLSEELTTTQKELEQQTTAYETLKSESKQFLELKAKYEKAVKGSAEARAKADKVDKELQQLMSSEINTGLLYGGGLIVLGFITGFIVKRPKRRSPLL